MQTPPTGTITFVFTDIQGSTRLWSEHPLTMSTCLSRHDELIRTASDQYSGYVFATAGDSFGVAFAHAGEAVHFAELVQRLMADEPWDDGVSIRVRIGMHTGTAEERDGDFFGSAVNLAARVEAAGHGGQVLLSSVTASLVDRPDIVELGSFRLKDVVSTQRIHQLGHQPFAPLRTLATTRGNLPGQVGRLIGREPDVQRVEALVQSFPITTIVGPGGIGKTRLALDVGRRQLANYDGGAWLVELAPATRSAEVDRLVANALDLADAQGKAPIDAITSWIGDQHHLIVLDNCEHVVDGAAEFSATAVARCPNLTVLATSREGLGVDGERLVPLAPLAEDSAAVELFTERALAVDPSFDIEEHRVAVEELCRRLDGVPLAVELAAARVRSIAPADLAERLDDRFRLLTAGRRSSVERHRTLRATVEWSYELLEPDEQVLFARLSVFVGTFDLRAVEHVAADETLEQAGIADVLGSLVNKSMVVSESGPFGRRFRLLETLRQFGGELLAESADTDRFSRRQAQWYATYLSELRTLLEGPEEVEGVLRVNEAWDNFRAAVEWSISVADIDLGIALTEPMVMELYLRGRIEIADWMEQLLEIEGAEAHPEYSDLVFATLDRYRWTADAAGHARLMERHPTADHAGIAHTKAQLSFDWAAAMVTGPPTAERIRSKGYAYTALASELSSASALLFTGRFDEYDELMSERAAQLATTGSPTMVSGCLQGLVVTATFRGDSDRAAALMDQIVEIELPPGTGAALWVLKAGRAFDSGDHETAFREIASTISGLLQSENMAFTLLIARQFVTWMAQLGRTTDVARAMGFYRQHMGRDIIWSLGDANQHLASRMDADLEHQLAAGAAMSLHEGLVYIGGVYAELLGQPT